ncbi:L,D-transpeptidase [Leptolyngbya boryana CZ1]|uniref:L,D-transpeptidase n=1 Tax=Leptolyngbya boryana CZ1 TaxID=3060204 RepID=A0AA96WY14_LEPBY|nr:MULTISPECIES: L,D-transpeptidase [Leptolyngbya]MBN8564668.1 L,D-transpeptidase [Leptolyngbya sp. UWPOB_LEPTO1]WNZ47058.1 L,D-transpeptidase [Leptolyngbya boryana CZ1]
MTRKKLKSSQLRTLACTIAALSLIYWFAHQRGILPFVYLLPPITCPADATLHTPPQTFLNANQSILDILPKNFDRSKTSILIEKSNHRLTLYYDQKPIKSYSVVFGDPQGDKRREGDRKTPEGILRIQDKYPHPDWSKFLWLDYPNAQSQCKHQRSKQRGEIPAFSAIGGEVGIHGVPIGQDALIETRTNWTLGCPALKNKDIDEIYNIVQVGAIVEILP